ncbi:MAG: DUF4139 domain-containing protein [Candidatus Krumholzibacteriota bacterium]|nr:DUF4139 domain-containing protein [Candidatus Krumholzibacteriota bacterium]
MRTIILAAVLILAVSCWAQEVSLTVYNQNRALVREVRVLSIEEGVSTISFSGVAALIDPTSVHFKSLTAPGKLSILEQNYEYDLVGAPQIMQKYVDEKVRLVLEKGELFEGVLLSASSADIILRDDRGHIQVVKGDKVEHFEFPGLPEGLVTRPTLVWMVDNQGLKKQKTEISYLTTGLNWHAEYVAVVDVKDTALDLAGWVSLDNRSGAAYENAKLKLVAGDINLVPEKVRRVLEAPAAGEAASSFEEKSFFEYHLYTLQRPTTIKNNQTKQVSLFPPARTKTRKIYLYDGAYYQNKVRVVLEFENRKNQGLGIPLPRGKVRVYKEDDDGSLEFIGEDSIDHTPRDEKVSVFMGNAFDLVGERIKQSTRRISDRVQENAYQIKLRNHKEEDVLILVREHSRGEWNISGNSHDYEKKDAETFEFKVPVKPDAEVILTYTITARY